MDPIIIDFSFVLKRMTQPNPQSIEIDFSKEITEDKPLHPKDKKEDSNETISLCSNVSHKGRRIEGRKRVRRRILKSKTYTSYPETLRLQVRKALKTLKPPQVAEKYNINLITLRRWIKEKFIRKERTGERCITSQIKMPLLKWINKKGIINLTKKEIREKAMNLCKNKDFKASHRWYQAFMRKCNLQKPKNARLELEKSKPSSSEK